MKIYDYYEDLSNDSSYEVAIENYIKKIEWRNSIREVEIKSVKRCEPKDGIELIIVEAHVSNEDYDWEEKLYGIEWLINDNEFYGAYIAPMEEDGETELDVNSEETEHKLCFYKCYTEDELNMRGSIRESLGLASDYTEKDEDGVYIEVPFSPQDIDYIDNHMDEFLDDEYIKIVIEEDACKFYLNPELFDDDEDE